MARKVEAHLAIEVCALGGGARTSLTSVVSSTSPPFQLLLFSVAAIGVSHILRRLLQSSDISWCCKLEALNLAIVPATSSHASLEARYM